MHLVCKRCSIEFEGENPNIACPRCSAREVVEKQLPKHKTTETTVSSTATTSTAQPSGTAEPRRFVFGAPITDTKESWKKFHNQSGDVQQCPACGEKEFDFNWKRREKVCKKCGEIMGLKRR